MSVMLSWLSTEDDSVVKSHESLKAVTRATLFPPIVIGLNDNPQDGIYMSAELSDGIRCPVQMFHSKHS